MAGERRILSLVPSATDWVTALGLSEDLVGVTHACAVPAGADPAHVVRAVVAGEAADPAGIDAAVRAATSQRQPLYEVDVADVAALKPTVVVTQTLCDVCAVSEPIVARLGEMLPWATVVTLDGATLAGALHDGIRLGAALDAESTARSLVDHLRRRLQQVSDAVSGRTRPAVGVVEWPDPVYLPGHWVPDQIAAAGGRCVAGESGQPSRRGRWTDFERADALVLAPCGFDVEAAAAHASPCVPPWLDADVWAADASRVFSRPSPGLVDGVEALAGIAHPDVFAAPDPTVARQVQVANPPMTVLQERSP